MKLSTTEYSFNASLSCIDLGHVADSMKEINQSRIKSLHYDIVDGQFNECFIFGDLMLKVFRSYTTLPITVHLACRNPLPYIKPCIAMVLIISPFITRRKQTSKRPFNKYADLEQSRYLLFAVTRRYQRILLS